MPKSKRSRQFHLTQVSKRPREQKDRLFQNIRDSVAEFQHCFVFSVDNMRNNHLKDVRRELSDSRLFFGKTKLMARALGLTPSESPSPNLHILSKHLTGSVGLLFTNRAPASILSYFSSLSPLDFARAGAVSPRDFTIPLGQIYSTAGEVPPEHDVPLGHTQEPELRRLGVPVRMDRGKVVLEAGEESTGEGYVVCREGDVLDSRQTRLLKLFGACLSEFRVRVIAYWSSGTQEVTEVDVDAMEGVEEKD